MRKTWFRKLSLVGFGLLTFSTLGQAVDDKPGPIDSLQDLQDSGKMLFKLADENNDGQISQKEAFDAGNLVVGGFFFRADANGDGVLSKDEAKAAQAAFNAADTDHNGQISQAEFDKAIIEPAHAVFRSVDVNNDGQLSTQEAQAARQAVMSQIKALRVNEPANSARNMIRTGADPAQAAPVPRFNATPAQP